MAIIAGLRQALSAVFRRSRPSLRICLEHKGRVVGEVSAAEVTRQEHLIGRGASCHLRVSEDSELSSQHAALVRSGRNVFVVDKGSKNGIYLGAERIPKRKLRDGDRITLGQSHLIVDDGKAANPQQGAGTSQNHPPTAIPELEALTGTKRGTHKPLQGESFSIGKAPECDLVLEDEYISRVHAKILRKGQSFWLKALSRTSPTKLNGEDLKPEQELELKDGNRIALAHVEIAFRDGTVPTSGKDLRNILAVMAMVTAVAFGAYYAWQWARDPAVVCLKNARDLNQAGQFDQARKELERAIGRRGFQYLTKEAALLRNQIERCASAEQFWKKSEAYLASNEWTNAAMQLGLLLPSPADPVMWEWRQGQEIKTHAVLIKGCLDAYFDAGNLESVSFSSLTNKADALKKQIAELILRKEHVSLVNSMQQRQQDLTDILTDYRTLEDAVGQLSTSNLDPTLLVVETKSTSTSSALTVKVRAEKLRTPIRELARSKEALMAAVKEVQDLHFKKAIDAKDDLPTEDACSLHSSLGLVRGDLDGRWTTLRTQGALAQTLWRNLTNRLGQKDALPEELRYWTNSATRSNILGCDSLSKPLPKRTRREPVGDYDGAVCIEWFYASLRDLGKPRDDSVEMSFDSRLAASLKTIQAARTFSDFLKRNDQCFLKGELQQWDLAAQRILTERDRVVTNLLTLAKDRSGREALIAGGIAWHLQGGTNQPLAESLKRQFAVLQKEVQDLKSKREAPGSSSADRIAYRRRILEVGLPGDPVVKEMWIQSSPLPP